MSSNSLMMRLQLQLKDQVSGALNNMRRSTDASTRAIKQNRDQLRLLERQNGLIQKIKRQQEAFKRANAAMRESQAQLVALKRSGSATAAQIKAQTALVKQNAAAFDTQKRKLVELRGAAANAGLKNLTNDERRLAAEVKKTTTALSQQEAALRRTNAARARRDQGLGTAARVGATGLGMYYGGRRAMGMGLNMVMPGIEFDSTMARVQALSRLDSGSAELAMLRQQADDLGASTMFSATEAAQGQAFLAMAGFSPENIRAAMPGLLDMALAGDIDLARTADIASNISSGFGINPAEMSRIADVLTATFTSANVDMEMLGETMKYMAPIARAAGVSIEDSAAMAALLGNVGIQGSSSGTQLRTMLTRLSTKGAETLEGLGIATKDDEGNLRDFTQLLLEFDQATRHMGSADRLAILNEAFDQRSMAGASELMQQIADGKLQEFSEMLRNSQGMAAQTARIMTDQIKGDWDEVTSGWEGVGISINDLVKDDIRSFLKWLAEVINSLRGWIKENPEIVKWIARIGIGIAALSAALGGLLMLFAPMIAGMAMFRFGMFMLTGKATGLLGAIKMLAGGFKMLFSLILAHPFAALIAVVAATAYAIYKNWDAIVWVAKDTWEIITEFFGSAWESLVWLAQDTWDNIKNFFSGGLGSISQMILDWSPIGLFYQAFAEVLNWFGIDLPARFTEFGGMIMQGLVDGLKNALGGVKDAIVEAGSSAIDWFKGILGIHSPSRVFMAAGVNISEGAALGIERGLPMIEDASMQLARSSQVGLPRFDGERFVGGAGGSVAIDSRAPLASGSPAATIVIQGDTNTFVLQGSGGGNAEMLQLIRAELDRREKEKMARARSSYHDSF